MTVSWDDLHANHSVSNGGVTVTNNVSSTWSCTESLTTKSAGKHYWEVRVDSITSNAVLIGAESADVTTAPGMVNDSWGYYGVNGKKGLSYIFQTYGASYTAGDVIGIALDLDNGKIFFSKNGVWQASGDPTSGLNPAFGGVTGAVKPGVGLYWSGNSVTARFAAATQTYSPPTGFSALEAASSPAAAVRSVVEHLYAYRLRAASDHPYSSPSWSRSLVSHAYAYRIRAGIDHPYRSALVIRSRTAHPYAGRPLARQLGLHFYAHQVAARVVTGHPYDLLAYPRRTTDHRYGMVAAAARAGAGHPYAITDVERIRAMVSHLCSHAEIDGAVSHFSESVMVGGVTIAPLGTDISWGRSEYAMTATIQLADAGEYQLFARGAVVTISLFGDDYTVVVESKSRRRAHGSGWTYTIHCLSPAAWLDSPHAQAVSGELTGLASVLAVQLAGAVSISWQTVDWYIPASTWIAADQTPLELLRTLAAAAGAILISEPDGSLTVEPAYPVAVPRWSEVVPAAVISEVLEVFEASDEDDHRPGYNRYLVSDQMTSSETMRIEDEAIGGSLHHLRVYQTPWSDDFDLRHTGGDWVFLEALGIEERQETETVEFVAGEGRTRYPIYGIVALSWRQVNLGTVTHGEDGLLAASVEGESLLDITYTTRARLWEARDGASEQVQFVAEEVPA